jgi:hypothetical protein
VTKLDLEGRDCMLRLAVETAGAAMLLFLFRGAGMLTHRSQCLEVF